MTTSRDLPDITEDDRTPAHVLRVELETRITSQPLHYRSGDEETAAKSVYNLFATTRKLLEENPKAAAFADVGVFLLNRVVRPYTARWHRWLVDERFANERVRREFRVELADLRKRLVKCVELLKYLVAGPGQQAAATQLFAEIVEETPEPGIEANLGPPVLAGIGREVTFAGAGQEEDEEKEDKRKLATVDEINRAERQFVRRRRRALGRDDNRPDDEPVSNATGLCLSGGGIRSATFCLGIVQVLARKGMLLQFDYLSTVSGGGYLGSFLTSYLGTPAPAPDAAAAAEEAKFSPEQKIEKVVSTAFDPVDGRESPALRHLRNNSRYLLNGGLPGRLSALGMVVSGIATNLLLVLPLPLLAVLAVLALWTVGYWGGAGQEAGWAPLVFRSCLLALGLLWFPLPLVQVLTRGAKPQSFGAQLRAGWAALAILAGLASLASAALWGLRWIFPPLASSPSVIAATTGWKGWGTVGKIAAALGITAPQVFGLLAARLKAGYAKKIAAVLFVLSGPLFCLLVFLFVSQRVANGAWSVEWVAGGTLALILWGWFFVDVNTVSPHGFYRNRLCECYLAVRDAKDDAGWLRTLWRRFQSGRGPQEIAEKGKVGTVRQLPLSEINRTLVAPYHLINATVNLPASREPNLRGRDSDFYLFSRDYCGGPVCGYVKTKDLEKLDPHVDLGTAMAISGAAAGANAGIKTLRQLRFLLALLNVRLGYWLKNPRQEKTAFWPGPLHLLYEMTGLRMNEKGRYLNLSDGGHIENLALYELLRRRSKLIVVIDGGMEPGMECADLMTAQRYAQIDLNVEMELDLADLALDKDRRSRAYAVFGKIRYLPRNAEGKGEPAAGEKEKKEKKEEVELGWLLYLKLAMTGGEPGYVVDYRRQNPDFPHQTTADQLYDEAQFEAYRRLGECAAESLFRKELTGEGVKTLAAWFTALASKLLPDNDPVLTLGAGGPAPAGGG